MRLSTLPAALVFCSLAFFPALHAQDAPDYKSNPKFQSAIAEAKQLQKERQTFFAMEAYKKANKIAAGKDSDCLKALLDLQMKTGSYKDAVATTVALEALAVTPTAKSKAESDHGYVLYLLAGDKNKPDVLNAADTVFKTAIANDPKNATALYLDGQVLAPSRPDGRGEQSVQSLP